eukprot:gene10830-biopygen7745
MRRLLRRALGGVLDKSADAAPLLLQGSPIVAVPTVCNHGGPRLHPLGEARERLRHPGCFQMDSSASNAGALWGLRQLRHHGGSLLRDLCEAVGHERRILLSRGRQRLWT